MNLSISYDAATRGSAPSAFFSAVNYVVSLFATFTNNATVNIEIGYGAFPYDSSTVPPLAESTGSRRQFKVARDSDLTERDSDLTKTAPEQRSTRCHGSDNGGRRATLLTAPSWRRGRRPS
jgi:hypothetical protein